jgi:hypothetical protein
VSTLPGYLSLYADFKGGAEIIIMAEKNLYGGTRKNGGFLNIIRRAIFCEHR